MNFLTILPREVAYLDPGSGSLIIQMLVAALLGGGVLLRSQWNKIKKLFGRNDVKPDDDKDDGAV